MITEEKRTMTKALLTASGLSWICLRDENGNYTGKREIALIIEYQSRRCNGKRCAFQQHYSETMVEHMKMSIDGFVKNSIYHFQKSIVAMCQRDNMEMMDIEECIYMLEHSLPQGFETFLNGDGLPWMQHYYTVIPVTRGTMYLGDDTAWHEAEEDMLLVVRDPWSETANKKDYYNRIEKFKQEINK